MAKQKVVVIGAGAVGASCTFYLQQSGFDVHIVDRETPGQGASFGNACTLANYACLPINHPKLPQRVPGMLFQPEAPLSLDLGYVLAHLPWMWQFLRACAPARVAHTIQALAQLLKLSFPATQDLMRHTQTQDILRDRAACYLYGSAKSYQQAQADLLRRQAHGVALEHLSHADCLALEPALNPERVHAGVQFTGSHFVYDPSQWVQRVVAAVTAAGATFTQQSVTHLSDANGQLQVHCDTDVLLCDQVVVAAGAFSRRVLGAFVEPIPLDTERGYHVMFPRAEGLLSRPVGVDDYGFYLTPMAQGLRVAGTVEIAGLDKPESPSRLQQMARSAKQVLPDLQEAGSTWLGFRPTLPDALPVLGRSQRQPKVLYAFGHQHIGLTLAAVTGQMTAAVAEGAEPPCDISAFRSTRFA